MWTIYVFILLPVVSTAQAVLPAVTGSNNQTSDAVAKSTESGTVAVSILYVIGGLFLSIFIIVGFIGVVRTYRHPARYGPREERLGRPAQSRAKGLARAVLDAIPIVKFSERYDSNADQATCRDIELANASEADQGKTSISDSNDRPISQHSIRIAGTTSLTVPVTAEGGLSAVGLDILAASNSLGCSICVEDFAQCEDVRVLPCNHKFHPTCIDPWLLNISGTCPLCRIDLRPIANTSNTVANSAVDSLPPPLLDETHNATPHRSHISNFKDLYHIARSRPEECIAALRRLYQENHHASPASTSTERIAHRESRLTSMLRDTFSVQTWQSDVLETVAERGNDNAEPNPHHALLTRAGAIVG